MLLLCGGRGVSLSVVRPDLGGGGVVGDGPGGDSAPEQGEGLHAAVAPGLLPDRHIHVTSHHLVAQQVKVT